MTFFHILVLLLYCICKISSPTKCCNVPSVKFRKLKLHNCCFSTKWLIFFHEKFHANTYYRVLPRPSLVVVIWFAQFLKTAAVYLCRIWANRLETSNSSSKPRGPHTRITWASLLGSEEPSLKFLRYAKLHRTNSSPISHCRCSKSAILFRAI